MGYSDIVWPSIHWKTNEQWQANSKVDMTLFCLCSFLDLALGGLEIDICISGLLRFYVENNVMVQQDKNIKWKLPNWK